MRGSTFCLPLCRSSSNNVAQLGTTYFIWMCFWHLQHTLLLLDNNSQHLLKLGNNLVHGEETAPFCGHFLVSRSVLLCTFIGRYYPSQHSHVASKQEKSPQSMIIHTHTDYRADPIKIVFQNFSTMVWQFKMVTGRWKFVHIMHYRVSQESKRTSFQDQPFG